MFHKMSHLVVVFTSHYIATKLWFFQNCFPTERKQMNKELARYDSPVTQELPYRETANRPLFNEACSSGKGKNKWVNMSDHVRQLERISHQMILTDRPQIANRKRVTSKAFRTKKLVNSQPTCWGLFCVSVLCKTNIFYVTVRLFSNWTQKCGKKISDPVAYLKAHAPDFCSYQIFSSSTITEQTHGNMQSIC